MALAMALARDKGVDDLHEVVAENLKSRQGAAQAA